MSSYRLLAFCGAAIVLSHCGLVSNPAYYRRVEETDGAVLFDGPSHDVPPVGSDGEGGVVLPDAPPIEDDGGADVVDGAACTPAVEVCNGQDDDCNGGVDDVGAPVQCGVGACATTVSACAACPAMAPEPTDACGDGVDNDCDGVVDEDCACDIYLAPSEITTTPTGATVTYSVDEFNAAIAGASVLRTITACVVTNVVGTSCRETRYTGAISLDRPRLRVLGGYSSVDFTRRMPLSAMNCKPRILAPETGDFAAVFQRTTAATTVLDGLSLEAAGAGHEAVKMIGGGQVSNNVIVLPATGVNAHGVLIESSPLEHFLLRNEVITPMGYVPSSAIGIGAVGASVRIIANRISMSPVGSLPSAYAVGIRLEQTLGNEVSGNTVQVTGQAEAEGIVLENPMSRFLVSQGSVRASGASQVRAIRVNGSGLATVGLVTRVDAEVGAADRNSDGILVNNAFVEISACPHIIGRRSMMSLLSGSVSSGVTCNGSGACVIRDNEDVGVRTTGMHPTSSYGIRVLTSGRSVIEHNDVLAGTGSFNSIGIEAGPPMGGSAGVTVTRNTVGVSAVGVRAAGSSMLGISVRGSSIRVANNAVLVGAGGSGIVVNSLSLVRASEPVVRGNTVACAPGAANSSPLLFEQRGSGSTPIGVYTSNIATCEVPAMLENTPTAMSFEVPPRLWADNLVNATRQVMLGAMELPVAMVPLYTMDAWGATEGPSLVGRDPMLIPGDFPHLSLGSPAIDEVEPQPDLPVDIDGHRRPLRGMFDIGAHEFGAR